MQAANLRDPYRAATCRQIASAWWAETWCAPLVFCWRQPFRSNAFANRPASSQPKRGLILLHGFVCNRGLWNGWYSRLVERDIPYIGVDFEPVFGDIDQYAAQIETAVSSLQQTTGMAPVVVAHSMGGLAVRAWLRHAGPSAVDRVHHIVTLGSPHRGTALARFAFSANMRQMTTRGGWIADLLESGAPGFAGKLTCMFSNCDNIVFPTSTATLPNARNIHITACAHVQMVDHPLAFDEVMRWLESRSCHCRPPELSRPHLASVSYRCLAAMRKWRWLRAATDPTALPCRRVVRRFPMTQHCGVPVERQEARCEHSDGRRVCRH